MYSSNGDATFRSQGVRLRGGFTHTAMHVVEACNLPIDYHQQLLTPFLPALPLFSLLPRSSFALARLLLEPQPWHARG